MAMQIYVAGKGGVVGFAAKELQRCLKLATGKKVEIKKGIAGKAPMNALVLGTFADFGVGAEAPAGDLNDHVKVTAVKKGAKVAGYRLSGSNERSVLFAVYQYLQALGFAWIRPGKSGEVVPKVKSVLPAKAFKLDHKASYKYRSICIEGACSREHVIDLIDWQTKRMMNGYFIQFENGSCFFKQWYERPGKDGKPVGKISEKEIVGIVEDVIGELKKRGLSFERVGHGWTSVALGITGEGSEGWGKVETSMVPEGRREWLAKIDGKREFFRGVPLNTNLDYARADVRSAVVDGIADYAGKHGEVDLLHFWLADGSNNHDEHLPERPSEYFVDMLNELDAKLTAKGLATKIVFLLYVDLLWAPVRARLGNPDRFILMFAPITRSYLTAFGDAGTSDEKKMEFALNKLTMPKSAATNLEYLSDWQKQFKGDGFDFDYHAIWACYYDPNMVTIAKTLHKDVANLAKIGLHGLNSCQNQRMSFPHNLLMDVMADALWDKKQPFKALVKKSFAQAFGKDAGKAQAFFERMSTLWLPLFDPLYIPTADEPRIKKATANIAKMRKVIAAFEPVVLANVKRYAKTPKDPVAVSWGYALAHLELLSMILLPMYDAYVARDGAIRKRFEAFEKWLLEVQPKLHPALDVYAHRKVMNWRVNELEAFLKENAGKAAELAGE